MPFSRHKCKSLVSPQNHLCHYARRRSSRCLPATQYFINPVGDSPSRVISLPTSAEQLIIVCFVMPNVGDDGEAHGLVIHFLSQRRAPDAAAVFQAGMLGDPLFTTRHDSRKGFADADGESIDEGFVEFCSSFGLALSASRSQIGIS